MKNLLRLTTAAVSFALLAVSAFGGPEPLPSGKEMKEVVPAPLPECNWSGFYVGLHAGGQFGHSESSGIFLNEEFGTEVEPKFGYSESGFVGGGQAGYNFQWNRLVLGIESDFGYMNLDGIGHLFGFPSATTVVRGATDSDFYTTFRGRVGWAFDWRGCWLIYGTGGGIGVNYETTYRFDDIHSLFQTFHAGTTDFDWGYVVGGGIERQIINRHWSVKVEYLYFDLDPQDFHKTVEVEPRIHGFVSPQQLVTSVHGDFSGQTFGHIIRAGLNFHF